MESGRLPEPRAETRAETHSLCPGWGHPTGPGLRAGFGHWAGDAEPQSLALWLSGLVGKKAGAMREAFQSQPLLWPPFLTAFFEGVFSDPVSSPFACMLGVPQKKVGISPTISPHAPPSFFSHALLTRLIHSSIPSTFPETPACLPNAHFWPPGTHSMLGTWNELDTKDKS